MLTARPCTGIHLNKYAPSTPQNPLFSLRMGQQTEQSTFPRDVPVLNWVADRILLNIDETDGPTRALKKGGPTGYNWEIARVEARNL